MRFSFQSLPILLALLVSAELLEARRTPTPSGLDKRKSSSNAAVPFDLKPHHRNEKRLLCGLLGLLCPNYSTDIYNCGSAGKVCPTGGWSNGNGVATCVNGVCGTGCNTGYTFSWPLSKCVANVNLMTDFVNCGAIGNVCPNSWANGVGTQCTNGICQPSMCIAGFSFSYAAKACIPIANDVNNCGSVGNVCSASTVPAAMSANTASYSCVNSACQVATCVSGYSVQNGVCVKTINLMTDFVNCGAIGNICPNYWANGIGTQCTNGICQPTVCIAGYAFNYAQKACVNLANDASNCGTVGNVCPSVANGNAAVCSSGVCSATCSTGYVWSTSLAQCISTTNDANNCGAIGKVCSATTAPAANSANAASYTCVNSVCQAATCVSGYNAQGGVCVKNIDLMTSFTNCGAIGNICQSYWTNGVGTICTNGICQPQWCIAGYSFNYAQKQCVPTSGDVNNCGAVGNVCSATTAPAANSANALTYACVNSACQAATCVSGYTATNGVCVKDIDLMTSFTNCGAIGNVCPSYWANGVGTMCANGICQPQWCVAGYTFSLSQKQCVSMTSDVNNCGAAGNVCPTTYANGNGAICSNGVCSTTCNAGFTWSASLSKCTSTTNDVNNCGALGKVCSATTAPAANSANAASYTCVNSICQAATCVSGYNAQNGVCVKNIDLMTSFTNCGAIGNVCPSYWANGVGTMCANGICQPQWCIAGYSFSYAQKQCVPTSGDVNNCGAVGNVCSATTAPAANSANALTYACVNSACQAATCVSGYTATNGVCVKNIDLMTSFTNCGAIGNVCPSYWANGVGTMCANGICQPQWCVAGYAFSYTQKQCVNIGNDVNNCGSAGNVCPTSWANGGASTCSNGVCTTTCNSGYAWSSTQLKCISTMNDVSNCGGLGTLCSASPAAAFATSMACVAGVCQATACSSGYNQQGGLCVKNIDTTSDLNNCGALKNVCPSSFANGVGSQCLNSICQPMSCNTGFSFSFTSKTCIDITSDASNCGGVGYLCSFPNGATVCKNSQCFLSACNTGFYYINNVCTSLNLATDVNNCGAVGNVCSFTNGVGTCTNSKCTFTGCLTGFSLINNTCVAINTQTDIKNCGTVGNVCQATYLNGGAGSCVAGKCFSTCNAGYTWDSTYSICRLTSSDINNCGGIGIVCSPIGSLSSICSNSQCYASACLSGYQLVSGVCVSIDTTSNVNNCGKLGYVCPFQPTGATGICQNSKCVITACPAKYTLKSGVCVASAVSQRPRVAKRKVVKQTPCPKGETACPIKASASFELAVTQHFTTPLDEYSGIFAGSGGYECLDTRESLESCGGCSSTGEGQDCTAIKGALGVGCDNGSCVVFSCQVGWKPNARGNKCIKSKPVDPSQRNATAHKGKTSAHTKKRGIASSHLRARAHAHSGHGSTL